jgi:hypothetical protein
MEKNLNGGEKASRELFAKEEFSDEDEPLELPNFSHGVFQLVGHGSIRDSRCGTFSSFYGCLRTELHDKITLDGVNFKNKVYVRKVYNSCDRPSCPVCYKFGWAAREAQKIEARLVEASKHFGKVEHIVCSVAPRDYGLSFEDLRREAEEALSVRGIVGGVLIFHAFRFHLGMGWYWNPHFHVLGFILGGYGRCRGCKRKNNCLKGCGGFDDRSYQNFLKDGWYVKVLGERVTVGGTAWYQLNHSSIDVSKKRFHVETWFGVCSYRKLKVTPELKKQVCPICQHDLEKLRYVGRSAEVMKSFTSSINDRGRTFIDEYENELLGINWVLDLSNKGHRK